MINITPSEIISDVEEAASSPESLERFPLLVDLFRILHIFEKLNKMKKCSKTIDENLDGDFVDAVFLFWIFVFG